MIFGQNINESIVTLDQVQESPYDDLAYAGVVYMYESERNFNNLMWSVAKSEVSYMQKTGKDLFVNEAGALSGFFEKVKAFFKKVIEKIQQIFKTFMAKINTFAISDKEFVRKYQKDIMRKNISDMEFKGWEKFKDGWNPKGDPNVTDAATWDSAAEKIDKFIPTDNKTGNQFHIQYGSINVGKNTKTINSYSKGGEYGDLDSDQVEDRIEEERANLISTLGYNGSKLTESEMLEELQDLLYGEKETFDVTSAIRTAAIRTIENTHDVVKKLEDNKKKNIKALENYIKSLDKLQDRFMDLKKGTDEEKSQYITGINNSITVHKGISTAYTAVYGKMVQAAKDCNRQAKALCVKILGYNKKESAIYSESTIEDDLFADVYFD